MSPQIVGRPSSDGFGPEAAAKLEHVLNLARSGKMPDYVPLLPLLFSLDGKPLTLTDHFPFEPLFSTKLPHQLVIKGSRQIGKTVQFGALEVLLSNRWPNFKVLHVTPFFEQVRRYSANYVGPLINQSPMKELWVGQESTSSILQRSFRNQSQIIFSFGYDDVSRIRGISTHFLGVDELQDIDPDNLPIIRECLTASKDWDVTFYGGTAKSMDNVVQKTWEDSSQAEWCVPCSCGKWNIPAKGFDIEKMIGPDREDISEARPALICAKCSSPINARLGRWVHGVPGRKLTFPGYHIPQIILPLHYANRRRWNKILAKQRGAGNTTTGNFYNEVLGESYDNAVKLVSRTELQHASTLPWRNTPSPSPEAVAWARNSPLTALAVDWGGGGEKEISFTTLAVCCLRPDAGVDVVWGKRLLTPHDHMAEAHEVKEAFNRFQCGLLAHDYTGAGSVRESIAVELGLPGDKIAPVMLCGGLQDFIRFHQPTAGRSRGYYSLDKTRSLLLTCNSIKQGKLNFFGYDYSSNDEPGLIEDFLSLVENKVPRPKGSDAYTISRNPRLSDDFAQAVNIGCCTLWRAAGILPSLAESVASASSFEYLSA